MSTSNDTHIILDKELRRDIDAIIQRLKTASDKAGWNRDQHAAIVEGLPFNAPEVRASRERSLAITKLQEAVMWLGMDLKAINDESKPAEEAIEREAKRIYEAKYSVDDAGKTWPWQEGGNSTMQDTARREARAALSPAGNPYPNSKDPSNTVIDKTADGLKL